MPKNTVSLDRFADLEREHAQRFAELASNFDFRAAEHAAVNSLNEVYRLAERARTQLEDGVRFEPTNMVVGRDQYNTLFQRYMTLEAEVRTFLASIDFDHNTRGGSKSVPVSAAGLHRLWDAFDYTKVDAGQTEPAERGEGTPENE